MRSLLFSILLLTTFFGCFAQKQKTVQDYLPTDNLEMRKDDNRASNKPKRKNYAFLYVPNADDILYGNPCVLQETHKMGFEYLVEPPNMNSSKTWTGIYLNNLWVKTKLVVTRTPFWKLILKRKIKKCRKMTGDLVG